MTDAPERIWAEQSGYFKKNGIYYNSGRWNDDEEGGMTPFVRLDLHEAAVAAARAEVAELKRRLGGGCEANNGDEHTVIREGAYAFCAKCGESLRGVRFCHLPQLTTEASK